VLDKLLKCMKLNRAITIVYLSDKGKVTKRFVRVLKKIVQHLQLIVIYVVTNEHLK